MAAYTPALRESAHSQHLALWKFCKQYFARSKRRPLRMCRYPGSGQRLAELELALGGHLPTSRTRTSQQAIHSCRIKIKINRHAHNLKSAVKTAKKCSRGGSNPGP